MASLLDHDLFSEATIEILAVDPITSDDPDKLINPSTRDELFFDELVPIHVLLHCPLRAEAHVVKDLATRIALSIEVVVHDDNEQGGQSAPESAPNRANQGQVIHSEALNASVQPVVIEVPQGHVILWKHTAALPYTRTRGPIAKATIIATLLLNASRSLDSTDIDEDAYMEESEAIVGDRSFNLLKALEADVFLRHRPPRITAARVSTLRPLVDSNARRRKKSAKKSFSITSAIALRTRKYTLPRERQVMLTAEIEPAQHTIGPIAIHAVELQCSSQVDIEFLEVSAFPVSLKQGEAYTFGFRITIPDKITSSILPATIKTSVVPWTGGSQDTALKVPTIISQWNTSIVVREEQRQVLNRTLSQSLPQSRSMQRVGSQSAMMQRQHSNSSTSRHHGSTLSLAASSQPQPTVFSGIKFNLRGPKHGNIGVLLTLDIHLTNDATVEKHLALEVARIHGKKTLPVVPAPKPAVKNVVLTEAEIKALHEIHGQEPVDAICLTNSLHIGSLPAMGGVRDLKIQYLPLTRGILQIHDLRLIELGTGSYQELKNLPRLRIL